MLGRHGVVGLGGVDGVELDYSEDAGDYQIGGQRVVADFEEFEEFSANNKGAAGGGAWKGGHGQEGTYDQEELVRSYPR